MKENNKYKIIFDKIEENKDFSCNKSELDEYKEIQELSDLVIQVNNPEQIHTYTSS